MAVENDITDTILGQSEADTPGLRLRFLESRIRGLDEGEWIEYFALYGMKKWKESANYLEHIFSCLSKVAASLKNLEIDSIGIQEVDCGEAENYYILIYILSNGREKRNKDSRYIDRDSSDY